MSRPTALLLVALLLVVALAVFVIPASDNGEWRATAAGMTRDTKICPAPGCRLSLTERDGTLKLEEAASPDGSAVDHKFRRETRVGTKIELGLNVPAGKGPRVLTLRNTAPDACRYEINPD